MKLGGTRDADAALLEKEGVMCLFQRAKYEHFSDGRWGVQFDIVCAPSNGALQRG